MRKIIIITIILLFSAGVSFAVDVTNGGDLNSTSTVLKANLSNHVTLSYLAAAGGLGYSATTVHSSGTRRYGSSSGDSSIFWIDGTGAVAITAPTGTASADFSAWTAL